MLDRLVAALAAAVRANTAPGREITPTHRRTFPDGESWSSR